MTDNEIIEKYKKHLGQKRLKKETQISYVATARVFLRHTENLGKTTNNEIEIYRSSLKNEASKNWLKKFVDWAEEQGVLNLDKFNNTSKEKIEVLLEKYFQSLELKNFMSSHIAMVRWQLKQLSNFLKGRNIFYIKDVSKKVLSAFVQEIYGRKYTPATVDAIFRTVKFFFYFLLKEGIILFDPSTDICQPRVPKPLYKDIVSIKDLSKLEGYLDLDTPRGLRNFCMIETLYATGVRSGELVNIQLKDIDFEERTILIKNGKGQKDRAVVFSEYTGRILQNYIETARKSLVGKKKTKYLFVGQFGEKYESATNIGAILRNLRQKAGYKKPFHPHVLRHSCASHMLSNGADIRYIQQQLGHKWLTTTQRYTKVVVKELKETIEKCHPMEFYYAGDQKD